MKAILGASLVGAAVAQAPLYAQCGGKGWNGVTTCVSGATCTYSNDYYSQCLPGSNPGPTTTTRPATTIKTTTRAGTPTTTASGSTPSGTKGKLRWLGVNESGAEFGQTSIPGVYGKDFTFASTTSIDTLMSQGFNIFRFPFLMERMVPSGLSGTINNAYLTNYTSVVNHVTQKGGYAIVDPHNFGRYNGAVITDTAGFQTFWKNLASTFKSNTNVIFDTNNEYHDMDQSLILSLNQNAINGIRASGATSQYIFAEGNSYSAAQYWNTTSDNLKALTDPNNKLVYEMHQYLDSDNSGTHTDCVSSTIGVERVSGATAWLRANSKVGIIGEDAGGANPTCLAAVTGLLDHLQSNSDVWLGYLWWGSGPWWGDYIYGFEPPSSTAYNYYDSTLVKYKP